METVPSQILQTALALPDNARADLAAELIASLDPDVDADYEASWSKEIKRRLELLDGGIVKAVPWSEARSRIVGQ